MQPSIQGKPSPLLPYTKTPANATGTFSVSPNLPAGLDIDKAGGTISGTPTAVTASKTYKVSFTGSGDYAGKTAETEVTIEVISFSIKSPSSHYTFGKNIAIDPIAFTKDPKDVTGTFSVSPALPAGLNFDKAGGTISGTPTAATELITYTLSFTGSEKYAGITAQATISVKVLSSNFFISPSVTSAKFNKDTAITPITFTKTPADATGAFSVSPNLPAGLDVDKASGTISGTPTAVTTSKTYTVSFTGSGDYAGKSAVADIAIEIITFSISPSSNSETFITGKAVTDITFTKSPAGATGTFKVTPALPAGLSFAEASGKISGTPTTVTASKTYTVSFTGSGEYAGITGTAGITIQVDAGPLSGIFATLNSDDTLSFGRALGDDGTAPALVSVAGRSSAGSVTAAALSGGNVSGAAAFLTAIGQGGTITVTMTVTGNGVTTTYSNTYGYYTTTPSGGVPADRAILHGTNKTDFTLGKTSGSQETSVISARRVAGSPGSPTSDTIVVTGSISEAVEGDGGNDILIGSDEADTLRGANGEDTLRGGGGDDFLSGDSGDDQLFGGDGDDLLDGSIGADILTGGSGSDTFEYSAPTQDGDTITDFAVGASGDKIELTGFTAGRIGAYGAAPTTATAVANGEIVRVKVSDLTALDTNGEVKTALGDGKALQHINLANNGQMLLVLSATDNGSKGDARVYHVKADGSGALTVNLLAKLQNIDAGKLAAANFGGTG